MLSPDSAIYGGSTLLFPMSPGLNLPFEYTGAKYESLASKTSAWIGTVLNIISPIYDIKGPDAARFLNSICVNDFTTLDEKGIRHAVICNEKGQILTDGVVYKVADDTFRTYWLNPPIDYFVQSSKMDVESVNVSGQEYFIQIAGEKSLEILEKACECDLHDIKFAKHRMTMIGDKEMRVLRLGMSGNLGYEVHGPMEDFEEVYAKIWEAGQSFCAKKQGFVAYNLMNHTEAGFPNINLHYPLPWFESDPGLAEYCAANPDLSWLNIVRRLHGSVGDELEPRFVTPYDVGWGFLVNFNHEFTGKEALEEIARNPLRTIVTLEWNAEDVGEIFISQFKGKEVEPCERIDPPTDWVVPDTLTGEPDRGIIYRADKVLTDGEWNGISSGRTVSYYYNRMISLGFIDPAYAEEGTELTLLWGTPGTPQKEIRVTVVRFPYLGDEFVRNEDRDVSTIPHYEKQ